MHMGLWKHKGKASYPDWGGQKVSWVLKQCVRVSWKGESLASREDSMRRDMEGEKQHGGSGYNMQLGEATAERGESWG